MIMITNDCSNDKWLFYVIWYLMISRFFHSVFSMLFMAIFDVFALGSQLGSSEVIWHGSVWTNKCQIHVSFRKKHGYKFDTCSSCFPLKYHFTYHFFGRHENNYIPRSSQWTHCLRMWSSILWHCSSFFISMRLKEASLLSAFRCADVGSFGRSRNWINGTGIKRRAERSGFKRWEGLWIWTCRRSLSKMERLLVWDRKNKICGMAYSLLHWSIFVLVLCWNFVVAGAELHPVNPGNLKTGFAPGWIPYEIQGL